MNNATLRDDLHDLAEQVHLVDLRERTLRTARRRQSRRIAMGATAVIGILAVGAGVGYAALPDRHPTVPIGATTGAPNPTRPVSAIPSPSAGIPQGAGIYLQTTDMIDGHLKDRLWYQPTGGSWSVVANIVTPTPGLPIVVAPDLSSVAWIDGTGRVQASGLDGSNLRTLGYGGLNGCQRLVYNGDSSQLFFPEATGGGGYQLVIVPLDGSRPPAAVAAATSPSSAYCGNVIVQAASGAAVAINGNNGFTLAGTGQPHTVSPSLPTGQAPSRIVALSTDGSRFLMAVTDPGGCGCSAPQRYFVVNSTTGRTTELTAPHTTVIDATFTADGRVVLLLDRNRGDGDPVDAELAVFGADGKLLATPGVPAASGDGEHLVAVD